jgi:hypothetical protein
LTRLNHAANLRKEINTLMDQWMDENASAIVARWLIEQREHPAHAAVDVVDTRPGNAADVSDNFFGEGSIGPPMNREVA